MADINVGLNVEIYNTHFFIFMPKLSCDGNCWGCCYLMYLKEAEEYVIFGLYYVLKRIQGTMADNLEHAVYTFFGLHPRSIAIKWCANHFSVFHQIQPLNHVASYLISQQFQSHRSAVFKSYFNILLKGIFLIFFSYSFAFQKMYYLENIIISRWFLKLDIRS